ncbi:hypothetical protein B0H14DRAFT_2635594 [Mycena olivaceomarginata]|nr:hypothetical protein B0H14DRAFT_2635594 [Mycena olivaceomarginata]
MSLKHLLAWKALMNSKGDPSDTSGIHTMQQRELNEKSSVMPKREGCCLWEILGAEYDSGAGVYVRGVADATGRIAKPRTHSIPEVSDVPTLYIEARWITRRYAHCTAPVFGQGERYRYGSVSWRHDSFHGAETVEGPSYLSLEIYEQVHNLHNIFQHIAPSEGPGSKGLALFTHAPTSEIVYHPMAAPIYNVNNKKICRIMNSLIDLLDPIYPEQNLKRERN